jgi:hypothetical protein
MGSPQQTSSPPPTSVTSTTFPQISQTKTCPTAVTFTTLTPASLSVGYSFLTMGSPWQTSSPPPASLTMTVFPQTGHTYTSPASFTFTKEVSPLSSRSRKGKGGMR